MGAHGYEEIRLAEFDADRFSRALNRLIARHDMLRAVFSADGTQRVLAEVPPYQMPCHDLRGLDPAEADRRLAEIRDRMSHQLLDASRWPLFEFAVTLLDGEVRLHLSTDALILDAASTDLLERELAQLYLDPDAELAPLAVTFRDCVLAEQALRHEPALPAGPAVLAAAGRRAGRGAGAAAGPPARDHRAAALHPLPAGAAGRAVERAEGGSRPARRDRLDAAADRVRRRCWRCGAGNRASP